MDSEKTESSDVEETVTENAETEAVGMEASDEKQGTEAAETGSLEAEAPGSQDAGITIPEDSGAEVAEDQPMEQAGKKTNVSIFKKIVLWAAIVIGGLFFLLGLATIIGVWAANTPLTNTILAILEPIDNTLQRLEIVSGEAAVALSEASISLDDADQRVQELGAGLAETSLALEVLNRILEVDLEHEVGRARDGIRSIYDTVVAVEETINAINAIPFVNVEVPGSSEMAAIRTGMEEMATSAEELRQENQRRREERAENLVTAITDPLNRLKDRIDEMQTRLTNAEARFGQAIERMDVLQDRVPRWIDIASIVATLLLAWLMFSQGAVIVLCWRALHPVPGASVAP